MISGVMDLDSHEMIPMHMWGEAFGERAACLLAPLARGLISRNGANSTVRDDIAGDIAPITQDTVWNQKGPDAPSAIDMSRRAAVLDEMGISRQFVFPTFALIGINLYHNPAAASFFGFDPAEIEPREAGRAAIDGYNDWATRIVSSLPAGRVRPVAVILTGTVDAMVRDAKAALAHGLRALWIPSVPPANTSPADRALDPFWSLAEDADVPVLLHVGTEFAFASPAWYANVPEFAYGPKTSLEFPIEPYRASTLHLAIEAFLGAMILGGVFERHPKLRFGVIECGAHWVGPLADKLDLWSQQFDKRLTQTLSMPPSRYLNRNVRVTPFFFEPIEKYLQRYPELSSVYAYGSDFPHVEGGRDSLRQMADRLQGLGAKAVEDFFVSNGAYLLPD